MGGLGLASRTEQRVERGGADLCAAGDLVLVDAEVYRGGGGVADAGEDLVAGVEVVGAFGAEVFEQSADLDVVHDGEHTPLDMIRPVVYTGVRRQSPPGTAPTDTGGLDTEVQTPCP